MRNALLLVALFLGGMTTQTMAQRHGNVNKKPGKKHRYYNSQSVRFVENDVLFTVFTDGTFSFTDQFNGRPYRFQKRNHRSNYYGKNGRRGHRRGYGHRPLRVKTDRYGSIVSVNGICISYKRNGKVRQIGSVPIYHQRGLMVQVGGMTLQYNRFGEIRNTFGQINRFNNSFWHDDWYVYND
ncbi:MAG: hypothetical protein AAF466_12845, partial [Bacteroidota bacterium]